VFLFNLIGRNPEVQETLYNEAQSLAPPGCDLTVDDLRKAKYLRACITESFRFLINTIFGIACKYVYRMCVENFLFI